MNDLIKVGFLSSPFGLKGEIKIISNLNHLDKILAVGNSLIIDNGTYIIKSSRLHKNNYIISFDNYQDINLIDNLLKKDFYIERSTIELQSDEYLYSDLYNCSFIGDDYKGTVSDVLISKNCTFVKVDNIIIPLIDKYIKNIDTQKKIIYAKAIGELRL